jgi:hypothetical protein
LLFETLVGAEKARCVSHGKQNIYQDATMEVEIIPMSTAILNELSGSPEAIHTIKKCHKFSPKDKIYLEQQFSVNPYSSTEDRAQITQRLAISEKMTQTWFNNVRQRRNAPRMTSTSRSNAPLSREELEGLDICTTHLEITF